MRRMGSFCFTFQPRRSLCVHELAVRQWESVSVPHCTICRTLTTDYWSLYWSVSFATCSDTKKETDWIYSEFSSHVTRCWILSERGELRLSEGPGQKKIWRAPAVSCGSSSVQEVPMPSCWNSHKPQLRIILFYRVSSKYFGICLAALSHKRLQRQQIFQKLKHHSWCIMLETVHKLVWLQGSWHVPSPNMDCLCPVWCFQLHQHLSSSLSREYLFCCWSFWSFPTFNFLRRCFLCQGGALDAMTTAVSLWLSCPVGALTSSVNLLLSKVNKPACWVVLTLSSGLCRATFGRLWV